MRVYECHRFLAQYFQSFGSEHKWLADHFFQNCLQWSMTVTDDEGQIAADGHCNIGLSLEASGKSQLLRQDEGRQDEASQNGVRQGVAIGQLRGAELTGWVRE